MNLVLKGKKITGETAGFNGSVMEEGLVERRHRRHIIPNGIRRIAAGIAFSTLIAFSSPAHAEAPAPMRASQEQMLSNMEELAVTGITEKLKNDYSKYKKGKMSENVISARITRDAARQISKEGMEPNLLAELVEAYKAELERMYNEVKPRLRAAKPAVAAEAGNDAKGKGAKPKSGAVSGEKVEVTRECVCEPPAQEGGMADGEAATHTHQIQGADEGCTCPEKDAESGEAIPLVPIPASHNTESIESEEPATPTERVELEAEEPATQTQRMELENEEPATPARTPSLVAEQEDSDSAGQEDSDSIHDPKNWSIQLPLSAVSIKMDDPHGNIFTSTHIAMPLMLGYLISEHVGVAVIADMGLRPYEFQENSKLVQDYFGGLGPLFQGNGYLIAPVFTMAFSRDNRNFVPGAGLFVSGKEMNLSISAQFKGKEARYWPVNSSFKWWDRESRYPIIASANFGMSSHTDDYQLSRYTLHRFGAGLQVPLNYNSTVYPSLVLGALGSYLDAGVNSKGFTAGRTGLSLTYDWLNIGAVWVFGREIHERFTPGEGTYERDGVIYNGTHSEGSRFRMDGFGAFMGFNAAGLSENVDLNADIEFVMLGGNMMFLPKLGIVVKW